MADVRDRLSPLEGLDTPDLWERVRQHEPAPTPPSPPHRDNRVAVISIAFALAIAAVGFVVIAFRSSQPATLVAPEPTVIVNGDIWVKVGGGEVGTAISRVDPQLVRDSGFMWTDSGGTFSSTSVAPELVADDYSFSPDGSQVVFSAQAQEGSFRVPRELFVMNVDGTDRRQLTTDGAYAGFPAWSPDGTSIVYASYRGEDYGSGCLGFSICPTDLYVIAVDGGAPSRLTADALSETTPTWSPDSSQLAFVAVDAEGNGTLQMIDVDGGARHDVPTEGSGSISFPSWSPDGTRILYLQEEGGANHVWVASPDGSQARDLADSRIDTNVGRPVWSPEGDLIAFPRLFAGAAALWLVDPQADRPAFRIAGWPGFNSAPIAWRPLLTTMTPGRNSPDASSQSGPDRVSTTYRLSDFEVAFPFLPNWGGNADDRQLAGVTYTATWVTPHYPGEGECTIVLTNEVGDEVGRKEFGFDGGRRVNVISHWEPIPVDSPPTTASGWCSGDPESPANLGQGYMWSDPRVTDSSQIDGIEITFDVTWVGDAAPGMRRCTLTAVLTDGSTRRVAGGIEIGVPRHDSTFLLDGVRADEVSSTSVSCHPPPG
jgi:Tol biopolymer transport system component